jgi:cation diffusion facilitator family transporter
MRVSANSIAANVVLAAFKLAAGFLAHSGAMLSDAVHSLSDVFSTFVVMAGVKMAGKAADKGHPYGHERLESVAALLLSIMLAATGAGIGYSGVMKIVEGSGAIAVPGMLALVAAIVSLVVKEAMYWYTRAAAKKINSGALMADAWHHRSDALSSVGSFAGILGARLGYPVLDPVASVIICLFIVKVAFDIFMGAVRKMTDQSCDEKTMTKIEGLVRAQQGVEAIDLLQTRLFGDKIYVDVEIQVEGSQPLKSAHDIAQRVHDSIETELPAVKHCMVHLNPAAAGDTSSGAILPDSR